jgi:hypothetical protein
VLLGFPAFGLTTACKRTKNTNDPILLVIKPPRVVGGWLSHTSISILYKSLLLCKE